MGVFSFLRKKRPVTQLTVEQVPGFLDTYLESVGVGEVMASFRREMRASLDRLERSLESLEAASLQNDAIPLRAKQVMEGNRKQYCVRVRRFRDTIIVPERYTELVSFAKEFSVGLESLANETQKNFYVLKEFLGNEVGSVATILKGMERIASEVQVRLERNGIEKVELVRERHRELLDADHRLERLQDSLTHEEARKSEPLSQVEKCDRRIKELQESHHARFLKEWEERLSAIEEERKSVLKPFSSKFSRLARPLRKLAKVSGRKKVIGEYLDDLAAALAADDALVIYSVLQDLKKEASSLDLKEKQEKELRKVVSSLTKRSLGELQSSLHKLVEERSDLEEKLKKDTSRMLISEQQQWRVAALESVKEIEKNIEMVRGELERTSVRLSWQKLRDALRVLDENVVLEEWS